MYNSFPPPTVHERNLPLRPNQIPQEGVPIFTPREKLPGLDKLVHERHGALAQSDKGRQQILDSIVAALPSNVDAKLARQQLELNMRQLGTLEDYQQRMDPYQGDAFDLLGGVLSENAMPGEIHPGDFGQNR